MTISLLRPLRLCRCTLAPPPSCTVGGFLCDPSVKGPNSFEPGLCLCQSHCLGDSPIIISHQHHLSGSLPPSWHGTHITSLEELHPFPNTLPPGSLETPPRLLFFIALLPCNQIVFFFSCVYCQLSSTSHPLLVNKLV